MRMSTTTVPRPQRTSPPPLLTRFIGREQETAAVLALLGTARLVTLTGAAGCGKTRLAHVATLTAAATYADGVCWVELAHLDDPLLVPQALAIALYASGQPSRPILNDVLSALEGKQVLVVLDNCEHLLSACRELVEALLPLTSITVLATSREPLAIAGEQRYPVPPMALPPPQLSAAEMLQFDAIRLFVERARHINPRFELLAHNATAVARICRHLDGIPLAIELASARLNVLTVEQIAARLDDRFVLLGIAPHVVRSHHKTLSAAIEWSYDLLSGGEQALMRRLSAFVGGFTLATAEAVCAGGELAPEAVLAYLSSLVDKSLVTADTMRGQEARFRLLEMVRQYAHDKLVSAGEWSSTRERFLDCFVRLTHSDAQIWESVPPQTLDWIESEVDNLRAAMSWSLELDRIESGLRLAHAMRTWWQVRGYAREGMTWYERLIARQDDAVPLQVRVYALTGAAYLAMFLGDATASTAWSAQALALCERSGAEGNELLSVALSGVASAARTAGDLQALYHVNERIIALQRREDDETGLGMSFFAQGMTALLLGHVEEARRLLDDALIAARRGGDSHVEAVTLSAQGDLARHEGALVLAARLYEGCLTLFLELGAVWDRWRAECSLAFTHLRLGDTAQAHRRFSRTLLAYREADHGQGTLQALRGYASLAAVLDQLVMSARLAGAIERHGSSFRQPADSAEEADKADLAAALATVQERLGDPAFAAEVAVGKSLSLVQAAAYALTLAAPSEAVAVATLPRTAHPLTEREFEIAQWIAQGLTNAEIAARFVLSKRTVEKHIANILSKLNFSNRAQIVRWALTDTDDDQPPLA